MRCHEARNLLGPYLDSELDAKTSLEIAQHLGSCADCARVFDAEAKLEARISRALRPGPLSTELWTKVEAKLVARPWWSSLNSLRVPVRVGFATAMAAVIVILAIVLWSRDRIPDLAQAVGQDHQEFLLGKFGPEFTGIFPTALPADWTQGWTPRPSRNCPRQPVSRPEVRVCVSCAVCPQPGLWASMPIVWCQSSCLNKASWSTSRRSDGGSGLVTQ